jgi:ribosomal protein S18 acetylase RimI-like enzyme
MRARQAQLGVPETLEWIQDLRPEVAGAAREAGLRVLDHPLMVFSGELRNRPLPPGAEVRVVGPDEELARIGAIPMVAFSNPGTAIGPQGLESLPARSDEQVDADRERRRSGRTVVAAAFVDGQPVASGVHVPVGDVTEVAGIGTLPAFRRRGLGAAVTACLVTDARERGIETIFLSAGDETIARVYASLGFERIGTSGAAEPA